MGLQMLKGIQSHLKATQRFKLGDAVQKSALLVLRLLLLLTLVA